MNDELNAGESGAGDASAGECHKGAVGPYPMPADMAEMYGQMVATHFRNGNFALAINTVAAAERASIDRVRERAFAVPEQVQLVEILPARIANALEYTGYFFSGQLLDVADSDLLALPNFGRQAIAAVDLALARLGLTRRHNILGKAPHGSAESPGDDSDRFVNTAGSGRGRHLRKVHRVAAGKHLRRGRAIRE